ncbi:MAG: hypothetical protein II401_06600 [Bacteroidales bacterium]|nr:hypothetical protein [Bacteroidales bacterium]
MKNTISPFQGLLDQVKEALETEMNAKNEAYLFIIQSGNFERFRDFVMQGKAERPNVKNECRCALLTLSKQSTQDVTTKN